MAEVLTPLVGGPSDCVVMRAKFGLKTTLSVGAAKRWSTVGL
jgi:hypothetical protein